MFVPVEIGELALALAADAFRPALAEEVRQSEGPLTKLTTAREAFRVDGETELALLGKISSIVELDDGRVLLLDGQQQTLQELDSGGHATRIIAGPGEGPGDLAYPCWMTSLGSDRVAVVSYSPPQVKLFEIDKGYEIEVAQARPDHPTLAIEYMDDANRMIGLQVSESYQDGSFTRRYAVRALPTLKMAMPDKGASGAAASLHSLLRGEASSVTPGSPSSSASTSASAPAVSYGRPLAPTRSERTKRGWKWDEESSMSMRMLPQRWGVGNRCVYLATNYRQYGVVRFDADGDSLRPIKRPDYVSRRRSSQLLAWRSDEWPGHEASLSEFEPDILALFPRPDGSLWVVPSDGSCNETRDQLEFDVFDPEGRYVRRLVVQLDLGLDRDLPFSLHRDALFLGRTHAYILTECSSNYGIGYESGAPAPAVIALEWPELSHECWWLDPASTGVADALDSPAATSR